MGFTRKPLGRGMGMAISKEVLMKVGYEIEVIESRENMSVTFKIFKK